MEQNDNPAAQQQTAQSATHAPPIAYMPNSVLNFFLSAIPGAGHMYQGLMQRGVLMMCVFAGFITLSAVFSQLFGRFGGLLMGVAVTGIVVTYFFSFFDSLRTCRLIRQGVEIGAYSGSLDNPAAIEQLLAKAKLGNRKALGAILVVIGGLALVSIMINRYVPADMIEAYIRPAAELLLPAALLIAGIILLARSKKRKAE